MKPLAVDFARRRPVGRWAVGALCAALLLVAGWQGWEAWKIRQQLDAELTEIARLEREIAQRERLRSQAAVKPPPPPYYRDALAIAEMASFPTDKVLTALESVRIEGVRVTLLEVLAAEGQARVELEFGATEAALRYLDELNAGETDLRWSLDRVQAPAGMTLGTATISLRVTKRKNARP